MHFDEYGDRSNPTIVFLHGANFVHTFGMQYPLSDRYHLVVPHITGYGKEAERVFITENVIDELIDLISSFGKKVTLVGFSLGAQIAFRLAAEHEGFFNGAVIVSPWLIKEEPFLTEVLNANRKQLSMLKNKAVCSFTGMMNGLPKDARKEFVNQMQKVSIETVDNVVKNGITLDSVPAFRDADIPVIAIAGAREQAVVTDSVRIMAERGKNCRCEIWKGAAHNIPPVYYKKFNALLCKFVDENSGAG